jgi:hypothetical protein
MASKIYQLRNLIEEIIIQEIGDTSSKPFPYKKRSSFKYDFMVRFGPNDKQLAQVDFQTLQEFSTALKNSVIPDKFKKSTNVFNLAYNVGGVDLQFKPSSSEILLRIMSTGVSIANDFIDEMNPDLLYVEPTPKKSGGSKLQKSDLYKAYIWKQLDKIIDYDAEQRHEGFIVYKK